MRFVRNTKAQIQERFLRPLFDDMVNAEEGLEKPGPYGEQFADAPTSALRSLIWKVISTGCEGWCWIGICAKAGMCLARYRKGYSAK